MILLEDFDIDINAQYLVSQFPMLPGPFIT